MHEIFPICTELLKNKLVETVRRGGGGALGWKSWWHRPLLFNPEYILLEGSLRDKCEWCTGKKNLCNFSNSLLPVHLCSSIRTAVVMVFIFFRRFNCFTSLLTLQPLFCFLFIYKFKRLALFFYHFTMFLPSSEFNFPAKTGWN